MSERRKIIRRRPATVVPEVAEVEEEVIDVADEEEVEEEPGPKPVAKRALPPVKVAQKPATKRPEPEVVEDEEEAELPAPKTVVKRAAPAVPVQSKPRVASKPSEPEPDEVASVEAVDVVDILSALLAKGHHLMLTQVGGKVVITDTAADTGKLVVTPTGRPERAITKAELEKIAISDEYNEFVAWWRGMTFEERVMELKKAKVSYEESGNEMVDNMRMMAAWMDAKGISKWKPEYQEKAVRDALWQTGQTV